MPGFLENRTFRILRPSYKTNDLAIEALASFETIASGIAGMRAGAGGAQADANLFQQYGLQWSESSVIFNMDDDPQSLPNDILEDEASGEQYTIVKSVDIGDQGYLWKVFGKSNVDARAPDFPAPAN